jgi:hypothetical protein
VPNANRARRKKPKQHVKAKPNVDYELGLAA